MPLQAKIAINWQRLRVSLDDASLRAFNHASRFRSGMSYRVSLDATGLRLERCMTGGAVQFAKDQLGFNYTFEETVTSTVVHHGAAVLEAVPVEGALTVPLGPVHLWPWARLPGGQSALTDQELYSRFRDEYNHRLVSSRGKPMTEVPSSRIANLTPEQQRAVVCRNLLP